jgi:putative oxidoreductase
MPRLLRTLFRTQPLAQDVALLLLRIVIGGFMAHHGYGKVFGNPAKFVNYVASIGVPLPTILGYAAIYAEFLGGILIVIGLLYRPATFAVAVTMLVAALGAHGNDLLGDGELAVLYACTTLAMMLLGAGRFSADAILFSRFQHEQ